MVAEVNRLVGDVLAAGLPLALPGIGTLRPEHRPARRISKTQLLPPARVIDFSSTVEGVTLARRLAEAAHCTEEQAEEIYRRWLGYTLQEEVLTIEGIGTLKMKHFALDPDFDRRLNPQGSKPITVRRRRRFDWTIAFGILAIVAAAGIGGYSYMLWQEERNGDKLHSSPIAQQPSRPAAETAVPETQSAEEPRQEAAATAEALETVPAEQSAKQPVGQPEAPARSDARPQPNPSQGGVMTMSPGRYYVVLGVFSTVENATRAVDETARKDGSLRCGIYRFGSKWMVSPFESADAEACTLFRNAHAEQFPDMWIYRAR